MSNDIGQRIAALEARFETLVEIGAQTRADDQKRIDDRLNKLEHDPRVLNKGVVVGAGVGGAGGLAALWELVKGYLYAS